MAHLAAVRFNRHINRLVDGARHHEAHVVVGVFADQVDTTRGCVAHRAVAV